MTESTQPLVLLRGALPMSASRMLLEGDPLSSDDIKVLGGGEIDRLKRIGLLGHRKVAIVETRTKAAKEDKDRIAELTEKLEQAESGDAVNAISKARDDAQAEAKAAIERRDAAVKAETTAKQQLKDAQAELKTLKAGQGDVTKKAAQLESHNASLQEDLKAMTSQRDKAQADATEASELAKTASDRVSELEAQLPALEKEKADAVSTIETHLARIAELEAEVETLTAALGAATEPGNDAEADSSETIDPAKPADGETPPAT